MQAALPLVVALVMLAVASAFGVWQEHAEPPQASHGAAAWAMAGSGDGGLSDATSMPATPQDPRSGRPLPGHVTDNEEDGTGDSLEVSAVVAVLVLLACGGGLLLVLRDGLAKLFSGCSLASERPG